MSTSFHISLPCTNIKDTIDFYTNVLRAEKGRNTSSWADINLYENQLTFVQSGEFHFMYKNYNFENTILPSFHFGILLEDSEWSSLLRNVKDQDKIDISPTQFLADKPGEHESFFVRDPNNYLVEFKKFKHKEQVFML